LGQRWANFLASLVHGSELSTVTVLLSTPAQISSVCGSDALACYSPQGALLYAPGEDPGSDLSAEAVITHEYGHHVAANRLNSPWNALDWGPKPRLCRYAHGRRADCSLRERMIRSS